MQRRAYIEQVRRLVYGDQPSDDANITIGLVNVWLDQAIGYAAAKNYRDSIALDGISYVNGSFYTTYKGISVSQNEQFLYRITLPHVPFGLGNDEGVSTLQFKDSSSNQVSLPVIWINQSQKAFYQTMRRIPNKILAYSEGIFLYAISTILLNQYTATVCMVSGGDSTDLDSVLNVPADYIPMMTDYLKTQLMFERSVPQDNTNDGQDVITTT